MLSGVLFLGRLTTAFKGMARKMPSGEEVTRKDSRRRRKNAAQGSGTMDERERSYLDPFNRQVEVGPKKVQKARTSGKKVGDRKIKSYWSDHKYGRT